MISDFFLFIVFPAHKRVQEDDFRTVDPATCSALVLPDFCYVTDISTNTCISSSAPDAFPTISVEIKVSNSMVLKEKFTWKTISPLEQKFKTKLLMYGMKYKPAQF